MNRHIQMRLKCTVVTPGAGGSEAVTLAPHVDAGGEENATFHNAETAPTAAVSFTVTNTDARGSFQVGKYYKVKITPVET